MSGEGELCRVDQGCTIGWPNTDARACTPPGVSWPQPPQLCDFLQELLGSLSVETKACFWINMRLEISREKAQS